MWKLGIPNDYSANGNHSYLSWAVCELWLVSYGIKTVPKTLHVLVQTFLWILMHSHKAWITSRIFILTFFFEIWCWIPSTQGWKGSQQSQRNKEISLLPKKSHVLRQWENHLVEFHLHGNEYQQPCCQVDLEGIWACTHTNTHSPGQALSLFSFSS